MTVLSNKAENLLIAQCRAACVSVAFDSKFGNPNYTTVQCSWPALMRLAKAVADAAVAADRAGRGEPFAYCFTDVNGRAKEFCDPPECAHPHDKRIITPLYTHPPHIGEPKKMVLPEKLKHTKVTLTEHDHGYIKGWNDCRETLLATQKEPHL